MRLSPSGIKLVSLLLILVSGLTACQPQTTANNPRPQIVATTTLIGDVVRIIGGDQIELQVMLPTGASPHAYQPTPQDIARVADADLVFANGFELETFLDNLLVNAGGDAKLISVSDGIQSLIFDEAHLDEDHADEEIEALTGEDEHDHEGADPHVWFDPNNLLIWVENITAALSQIDPQNAADYQANARAYAAELRELDSWIIAQVAQIPTEKRLLVSDHLSFSYFAEQYDFQQVGTVLPGISDQAEPSGAELAALQERIQALGVPAIFVGATANTSLAQRIAEDTGVALILLYTGSLTGADGPASTYLDFMRYNVTAIVTALK